MANNQVEGDILTLLRLLNRRHDDKYRKGLQVKGDQRYHQYFQDNIMCYGGPPGDQDDMLFFVKRCLVDEEVIVTESRNVQVYRRTAKNLPSPTDEMVLWDETVCLNIILQNFNYIITMATFTDDNYHVTKRWSHAVFASPNKRRMDSKGDTSINIDYPNLYFYIDEFEEVFKDFTLCQNQNLAIELVAIDKANPTDGRVIFQGTVKFQAAWEQFIERQSEDGGAGMFHRMLERVRNDGRDSFVQFASLKGPDGRGKGEVALRRVYNDAATLGIKSNNDDADHQEAISNTAINWKGISPSKEIQKLKLKAQNLLRIARFDTTNEDPILSAQLTFIQIKLYDIVHDLTSEDANPVFWSRNDCLS